MSEPHDIGAAAAVHAFLERFAEDHAAQAVQPLETYQAVWPGHEEAIAREYEALTASTEVGAGALLGPFRIEAELGRGAQGVVYRAVDERIDRVVALKVLQRQIGADPRTRLRFQREAQAASRLDHPGICTVYESGVADGVPFIAMRYVEGEPLSERIAATKTPPVGDDLLAALAFMQKTAQAVHAAHEERVLHRDLKPGNVMVTEDGDPVILDFGLAGGAGAGVPALTATGDVFGSPAYMAPEQLKSDGTPPGRAADVYALGVVLYEAVTLERPYGATTLEGLYRAILHNDIQDPRERNPRVSRDLAVVLQTALALEPSKRYESAAALAEDLRRLQHNEPIQARPAPAWLRLWRWSERNRLLAASVVGLFLVITTALVIVSSMLSSYELGQRTQQQAQIEHLLQRGYQRAFGISTRGARAPFEEALRMDPTNAEALVGRVLVELPAAAEAQAVLDRFGGPFGDDPHAAWLRGAVLRAAGKEADAAPHFTRARNAPPSDLRTFLEGQAAVGGFAPPVASDAARKGLALFREAAMQSARPRFHHYHAWMMAAHHVPDREAMAEAEQALRYHWPESQATWEAIAQFYFPIDRPKALAALQRVLELGPSAGASLGLGSDALSRDDTDGAMRHFDAAVAADPELAAAHWMRGNLLTKLGKTESAARAYAHAVKHAEPFFRPTARAAMDAALRDLPADVADAIRRTSGAGAPTDD